MGIQNMTNIQVAIKDLYMFLLSVFQNLSLTLKFYIF